MKNILLIVAAIFCFSATQAQQDTKAKEILDKLASVTKTYKTIKAEFVSVHDNTQKNTHETKNGTVTMKGEKYKLAFMGSEIFCNGKTMWTYMKDAAEVNIRNINQDKQSELNPAKLLTIYNDNYKYKFIDEKTDGGKTVYEIDLYPNKPAEKTYSRVKLLIDKAKMQITSIKTFGKDGNNFTINIQKFITDEEIKDDIFTFNEKNYPGVEVIDLRE